MVREQGDEGRDRAHAKYYNDTVGFYPVVRPVGGKDKRGREGGRGEEERGERRVSPHLYTLPSFAKMRSFSPSLSGLWSSVSSLALTASEAPPSLAGGDTLLVATTALESPAQAIVRRRLKR